MNFYHTLYQCCLHSLREKYPVESLTCDTARDIVGQRGLSTCLDILVNIVVDATPLKTSEADDSESSEGRSESSPFEELRTSDDGILLADFVCSMFRTPHWQPDPSRSHHSQNANEENGLQCSHALCMLRSHSLGTIPESDLYRFLLLEFFYHRWTFDCANRSQEVWSPMPWSQTSRIELSTAPVGRGSELAVLQPQVRTLCDKDLYDADHPTVTFAHQLFGPLVDIPWLDAPHDGYPFCATLSSYTRTRLFNAVHSRRDDLALWMSAMTFGLLEVVTRTQIPESLLIIPGGQEGDRVISGTQILRILTAWYDTMSYASPESSFGTSLQDARREHGQQIAALLKRAMRIVEEPFQQHFSMFVLSGFDVDQALNMLGAVTFLVSFLCVLARELWSDLPEIMELPFTAFFMGSLPPSNVALMDLWCRENMLHAGWCPYFIPQDIALVSIPLMKNLPRLKPYVRSSPDEHKSCTKSSCVFYSIDTSIYVPRHTRPSCSCDYIKPPIEDVVRLLSEGAVPVVVFDGSRLRVQSSDAGPYVAISHVWADGMGSTTEDGLPACVVERLSCMVASLLDIECGSFWIDSLCIPGQGKLRKRAIKLMASTYQDAAKVLVVDECIRNTCSKSLPFEENLFRIAASGWNKRVWTLQEGLLARELWFEFLDGVVNIDERPTWYPQGVSREPPSREQAQLEGTTLEQAPQVRREKNLYRHDRIAPLLEYRRCRQDDYLDRNLLGFSNIIRLLEGRTTTKPEDETLAVATLLPPHVDLDALLSINGNGPDALQQRMKAFLIQMKDIPLDLLALPMPRLTIPHFFWAPLSLLSIRGSNMRTVQKSPGTCTDHGLLAEFYVAPFERPMEVQHAPEPGRLGFVVQKDSIFWDFFVDLHPIAASQHDRIEALLFGATEACDDIADGCIMVSGPVDDGVLRTNTQTEPLRLSYMGSAILNRASGLRAPPKERRTVLGPLTKAWVLLQ
ncbi:hypothetical protein C8Q79DRAFT_650417 [Trametes meyenii]|nr:hypothetical protein C8Q79DRAFT_650417 [Trametes meyenii]